MMLLSILTRHMIFVDQHNGINHLTFKKTYKIKYEEVFKNFDIWTTSSVIWLPNYDIT